jgi:hypothetical protein
MPAKAGIQYPAGSVDYCHRPVKPGDDNKWS